MSLTNFEIGDEVVMVKEKVIKKLGSLPRWFTTEILIIVEIKDKLDNDGNKIITVDKKFNDNTNDVTTLYLDFSIKCGRRKKLKKINDTRRKI
jgi:DNA-binding MltR family transcriptional regulator